MEEEEGRKMNKFIIPKTLSLNLTPKFIGLFTLYGKQVWALCKSQKEHRCIICGTSIHKSHLAYRPITNIINKKNKMIRICQKCVAEGIKEIERSAERRRAIKDGEKKEK